jgi:hypothetical protein
MRIHRILGYRLMFVLCFIASVAGSPISAQGLGVLEKKPDLSMTTEHSTSTTLVNLLDNSGFESDLTSWSSSGGSAVYSADSQTHHTGSFSAKGVEINPGSLGRLYQDVTTKLTPNSWYQLSGWIKTENVTGSVVIGLDYVTPSGGTPAGGYVREIGYVSGTSDWTYYQSNPFLLPAMPAGASALWVLFDFNAGAGTAYWDDITLSLVPPVVVETSFKDKLAEEYPCGMKSIQVGISLSAPPLVDTYVYFRVNNPVTFEEAYLEINGQPTSHISTTNLQDPTHPGWYRFEVSISNPGEAIGKALSGLFLLFPADPTIFFDWSQLNENGASPLYGYVEKIVLVGNSGTTYEYPYTNQLPLYTIYNRYFEETDVLGQFGLRCSQTVIQSYSPVNLLLTDSEGRQTGAPFSGTNILDIPNSFYSGSDSNDELIIVYSPLNGSTYNLQVTGTATGTYGLIMAYHYPGWEGSTIGTRQADIATESGKVDTYALEIPLLKIFLPSIIQK